MRPGGPPVTNRFGNAGLHCARCLTCCGTPEPNGESLMTASPNNTDTQSALRKALVARSAELGSDPDTVWCPSPHAVAARRPDGGLLRLDFGDWSPSELAR